ncbi:hypothetical protein SAMN05421505_118131 [Sinosporangium album]|uniref:Uncharacterized protein n=1 Tax=Sinosporangium album TaxID=504805 RepID=A0A1G8DPS4_9ACTN|nr:bacteriocin fulvocin C-related protein [Sinosporangium album]SDH59642.1 hypothetical protein SAMN05421505_118131 [Sinosporangium album]
MNSTTSERRWILGFDGSCGRCREIAKAAEKAAGARLEVLPLSHPDVRRWRDRTLGTGAPWVPTLVRVDGDRVRAWTGPAMGLRLLACLGPAAAIRLFRALGELSQAGRTAQAGHTVHAGRAVQAGRSVRGRRQFFKVGAGLGIAAGIVLVGKAPALADDSVGSWIAANRGRLPKTYGEFSQHTMPYRRAIFTQLDPGTQSRLWLEHFAEYRRTHPGVSPEQDRVLAAWEARVKDVSTFVVPVADIQDEIERLRRETVDAYGFDEAYALIATLGPVDPAESAKTTSPTAVAIEACKCSTFSDWCRGASYCIRITYCGWEPRGCGTLFIHPCNGWCSDTCGC